MIRAIHVFLKTIKHPKANEFTDLREETDSMLGEHLLKSGNVYTYEIPTEGIKKMLESDEISWETKIFSITHMEDDQKGRLKSKLDFKPQAKHPILDFARSNVPTNDYFSFSHQQNLRDIKLKGGIATKIMMENHFDDSTSYIMEEVAVLERSMSIRGRELTNDFELLTQMLYNVFRCEILEEIVIQSLCYGAATFISTYIEKLLRLFFVEQTRYKIYVPAKNITLGQLLKDKENEPITNALGKYQTIHLRYFLLNDENGSNGIVGCNYRNRLAHWNQMKPANLTKVFVAQLFYLLLSVINSLLYYYLMLDDETVNNK